MDKEKRLRSRVKKLKAAAQLLYQEAIDIEAELEGLYPLVTSNTLISIEERAKIQAAAYCRRNIPLKGNF